MYAFLRSLRFCSDCKIAYNFYFSAGVNAPRKGVRILTRARGLSSALHPASLNTTINSRTYSYLLNRNLAINPLYKNVPDLLENRQIIAIASNIVPARTVTKFSLKRGKRKTVKAVVRRFLRLHWGGWIRTKCGRHKKIWKKSLARQRRLRQHVFCNGTQSKLLDKMVTKFWKKPKYYVEDPYEPYHTREEFAATRRKPVVRNV